MIVSESSLSSSAPPPKASSLAFRLTPTFFLVIGFCYLVVGLILMLVGGRDTPSVAAATTTDRPDYPTATRPGRRSSGLRQAAAVHRKGSGLRPNQRIVLVRRQSGIHPQKSETTDSAARKERH